MAEVVLEKQKMNEQLKDKVAIITGGTRGIGKAIAELFAEHGAKVIITGRSPESKVAKELGSNVKYIGCDIADSAACENLIKSVLEEFSKIDVLVNNAGITQDNLFVRMTEDQWTSVMDVNLNSLFYLCQPVIKAMSKQRSGSIINMSSVVGLHGNPAQVNYATTKAGLIGFTKSLAKEYGRRGIRVNAIAPGFVETDMIDHVHEETQNKYKESIPLGRFGNTKDIAELALFLAAGANYITGQVIQVDGGLFM